jgi:hypothetical protein
LQEAELFRAWVEAEEAKVAAAEAAAAVAEEEDVAEGPTLPGQALINKAKANLGGFMLPGEGDRWVLLQNLYLFMWLYAHDKMTAICCQTLINKAKVNLAGFMWPG